MDGRRQPLCGQVEPQPSESPRESSLIVFCGDEQQVRKGFAIALRAIGIEAHFLAAETALRTTSLNREDN